MREPTWWRIPRTQNKWRKIPSEAKKFRSCTLYAKLYVWTRKPLHWKCTQYRFYQNICWDQYFNTFYRNAILQTYFQPKKTHKNIFFWNILKTQGQNNFVLRSRIGNARPFIFWFFFAELSPTVNFVLKKCTQVIKYIAEFIVFLYQTIN
jgi:hypothetical protein